MRAWGQADCGGGSHANRVHVHGHRRAAAGRLIKTAHLVCENWPQTDLHARTFSIVPGICSLQHFAVERGGPMFVPFYSTVLLAFESGNVIGLRMMKMMSGGSGSHDEAHLMVTEKLRAMLEAGASLMAGGTASSVVDRTANTLPQTRNGCRRDRRTWFDQTHGQGNSAAHRFCGGLGSGVRCV